LLRYAPNPRRRSPRVAVVVAKKVEKSAVVRNRIRRRMYAVVEALLLQDGRIGDRAVTDLVFTVVDAKVATISEKTIKNTVYEILQTAGMQPGAVEK
jgi:ribonuclease P protein component